MTFRYIPATASGWITLVADDSALLMGGPLNEALVEGAWAVLHEGAAAILESLTSRGLQATPPFALIELADAGIRVIVRGDVVVNVGGETVQGTGAATWIERVLPTGVISAQVLGAVDSHPALPIVHGVVLAASLHSSADAAGARSLPRVENVASEATPAAPELATAPQAVAALETVDNDYDYLFGATMYRSVADAAVRSETEDDAHAEPSATVDESLAADAQGDHDGATMLVSQLGRGRGRKREKLSAAAPPPAVNAVVISLPGGGREVLDEPLVLGRAPSVSGIPGGQLPRLVTLTGGDQDISRSHLRLELQGGTVVVTDLHSKNGTRVTLPGQAPVKLRGGEPTPIIVGTVIDVGGVIDVTVQDV